MMNRPRPRKIVSVIKTSPSAESIEAEKNETSNNNGNFFNQERKSSLDSPSFKPPSPVVPLFSSSSSISPVRPASTEIKPSVNTATATNNISTCVPRKPIVTTLKKAHVPPPPTFSDSPKSSPITKIEQSPKNENLSEIKKFEFGKLSPASESKQIFSPPTTKPSVNPIAKSPENNSESLSPKSSGEAFLDVADKAADFISGALLNSFKNFSLTDTTTVKMTSPTQLKAEKVEEDPFADIMKKLKSQQKPKSPTSEPVTVVPSVKHPEPSKVEDANSEVAKSNFVSLMDEEPPETFKQFNETNEILPPKSPAKPKNHEPSTFIKAAFSPKPKQSEIEKTLTEQSDESEKVKISEVTVTHDLPEILMEHNVKSPKIEPISFFEFENDVKPDEPLISDKIAETEHKAAEESMIETDEFDKVANDIPEHQQTTKKQELFTKEPEFGAKRLDDSEGKAADFSETCIESELENIKEPEQDFKVAEPSAISEECKFLSETFTSSEPSQQNNVTSLENDSNDLKFHRESIVESVTSNQIISENDLNDKVLVLEDEISDCQTASPESPQSSDIYPQMSNASPQSSDVSVPISKSPTKLSPVFISNFEGSNSSNYDTRDQVSLNSTIPFFDSISSIINNSDTSSPSIKSPSSPGAQAKTTGFRASILKHGLSALEKIGKSTADVVVSTRNKLSEPSAISQFVPSHQQQVITPDFNDEISSFYDILKLYGGYTKLQELQLKSVRASISMKLAVKNEKKNVEKISSFDYQSRLSIKREISSILHPDRIMDNIDDSEPSNFLFSSSINVKFPNFCKFEDEIFCIQKLLKSLENVLIISEDENVLISSNRRRHTICQISTVFSSLLQQLLVTNSGFEVSKEISLFTSQIIKYLQTNFARNCEGYSRADRDQQIAIKLFLDISYSIVPQLQSLY